MQGWIEVLVTAAAEKAAVALEMAVTAEVTVHKHLLFY
jgi:hypothetical protein